MPAQLQISERQEAILRQIIRRTKSPQNLVIRTKIVLAGSQFGQRNRQIARDLEISDQTVSTWRGRWLDAAEVLATVEADGNDQELEEAIIQVLSDQPRSGVPPTFTAEQICQILALACESPALSGRPISAWTLRELTDEAIRREIVKTISATQVWRFLKRGGVETASEPLLAE